MLRQPKWGHLKELHAVVKSYSTTLLEGKQNKFSLGQLLEDNSELQQQFSSWIKVLQGQVLNHINLGHYLSSRVPSLKGCSGQKPNSKVKASSIKLLAHIMQFLQRAMIVSSSCLLNTSLFNPGLK
ncbi:hypothetical protein JHK87_009901 [Glycine soja]|nr:hypothetical protein JHK87_009901 [Glycine soja]